MDWVWTDTTLSLSDWMCVEDIYANIFIIKCSRETEKVRTRRVRCLGLVKYVRGLGVFKEDFHKNMPNHTKDKEKITQTHC